MSTHKFRNTVVEKKVYFGYKYTGKIYTIIEQKCVCGNGLERRGSGDGGRQMGRKKGGGKGSGEM